jgi:hypothetical protein
MKVILPVVVVLSLCIISSQSCSTDDDCGLLGDCVSQICQCDAGWEGSNCSSLKLLPAPVDSGLRQHNSSNWCGTVLSDDNVTFHSYNADFGGCANGLNIWLTGSRVIHSTSTSPLGPFTPTYNSDDLVAISAEAHNPQAIRAPDGTYILMDSYGGPDARCPLEANYSTCHGVGQNCPPKMPMNGGIGWWVFHIATSPAGPWKAQNVSVDFPCHSENLTPSPFFHPNGTLYIVFHCDTDSGHAMCDLTMVRSDNSWNGPFTRVNNKVWDSHGVAPHPEDPFLFIRKSPRNPNAISFHIILHNTPRGLHLYSRDGLNFTLQQKVVGQNPVAPFVFDNAAIQTDGTNITFSRRERPVLIFQPGSLSTPMALITSAQSSAWKVVFTHIQGVDST